MDPRYSAQNILLCDLCQRAALQCHCELCQINLCKSCVVEHLSNSSKRHNVVPYIHRTAVPNYPKCSNHTRKHCEMYCEKCDIPVCSTCISSGKHKGHNISDFLKRISLKMKNFEKDLTELEKQIDPACEEFLLTIRSKKVDLEQYYKKLIGTVIKQGEEWHKEINTVVDKRKSEIDEMKIKHLTLINKQESEIKQMISDVKQSILDMKKILDSNDVSLTSAYKSRNAELRSLPLKVNVSLPTFSPQMSNTNKLHHLFGTLSELTITTEEHGYTMKTPEAVSFPPVKPLLDEPELITSIDTGYELLYGVTCLSDEEIWTYGDDKIMKLYNLQGNLLQAISTKSRNIPCDIAVTRSGDLVYTDRETRTVNIVKNKQIQEVIRLQWWIPYFVYCTSSGELLVTMKTYDGEQSKVVRYSGSTEKQIIQFDDKGQPLYSSYYLKYISENRNLDVCVADNGAKAVVVVNQEGKFRFRYTGHPSTNKGSFDPVGITTDSQSQILTLDDHNNAIHILDQDGQLLHYIINCNLYRPRGLCVDTRDNLLVAECHSGKVKKIKYM